MYLEPEDFYLYSIPNLNEPCKITFLGKLWRCKLWILNDVVDIKKRSAKMQQFFCFFFAWNQFMYKSHTKHFDHFCKLWILRLQTHKNHLTKNLLGQDCLDLGTCIIQYRMFKPIRLAQNAKSSVCVSFNCRKNFLKFELLECNWLDNIKIIVKQFPNRHPFVRTSKIIWITKWIESTIWILACITLLNGKQPKICANL